MFDPKIVVYRQDPQHIRPLDGAATSTEDWRAPIGSARNRRGILAQGEVVPLESGLRGIYDCDARFGALLLEVGGDALPVQPRFTRAALPLLADMGLEARVHALVFRLDFEDPEDGMCLFEALRNMRLREPLFGHAAMYRAVRGATLVYPLAEAASVEEALGLQRALDENLRIAGLDNLAHLTPENIFGGATPLSRTNPYGVARDGGYDPPVAPLVSNKTLELRRVSSFDKYTLSYRPFY